MAIKTSTEIEVLRLRDRVRELEAECARLRQCASDGASHPCSGSDIRAQDGTLGDDDLSEAGLLYRQAAAMAKLGYWIWDETAQRYITCSDELAHIYGMPPETFAEWFSTGDPFESVHPDDQERYRHEVDASTLERRSYSVEFRETLPSGEMRYLRESGQPFFDENGRWIRTVGVIQDVTEHTEAVESLRHSEKNFRALAEGSIQGILIHRDMCPLFANEACAAMLGFESARDVLATSNLMSLVYPDDRRAIVQRHAARKRGEQVGARQVSRFLHRDGSTIWLESFISTVDWEDEPAILGTFVDVTERKETEDALLRAREELERRVQARTAELETINAALQREILERRQTDERLAASEERLRQACRLVGLGHYVWDSVGDRCLVCSDEHARIHGTTPEGYIARASGINGDLTFTHAEDRERYTDHVKEMRRTGKGFEIEYRTVSLDDEIRHIHEIVRPVIDADGKVVLELGVTQDITRQKQTEDALREQGARLREALHIAKLGHWSWDPDTNVMTIPHELSTILRMPADAPDRMDYDAYVKRYVHPDDLDWVIPALDLPEEPGARREVEYRLVPEEGDARWVLVIAEAQFDNAGNYAGESGTVQDITERKEAEQALQHSEARLAKALKQSKLAHWTFDFRANTVTLWSDEAAELLGIEHKDLPRHHDDYMAWIHPDDRERVERAFWPGGSREGQRRDYHVEYRIRHADGSYIWLHDTGEVEYDAEGNQIGFSGAIQDITQRKHHEIALRESEERFRSLVENSPAAIYLKDSEGRFQTINRRFEEWYGRSSDEVVGKTAEELFLPELARASSEVDRKVVASGETSFWEVETPFADGTLRTVLSTKFPIAGPTGEIIAVGTINTDITENKRAQAELDEQRQLLETIISAADIAINVKDSDFRYVFVNDAAAAVFGLTPGEMIGKTIAEVADEVFGELVEDFDSRALASGLPLTRFEHKSKDWEGKDRDWLVTKAVIRTDTGDLRYLVGASVDLTDLKAHEQELKRSYKMEALGQLTSGIAHDFNNLLLLINANLFALQKDKPAIEDVHRAAESIKLATETANNLTSSLMAFSRDQPLSPEVVDLPSMIERTVNSLFRTLMTEMQIVTSYKNDIKPVLVDEQYLGNALLNLAINARDAMPEGGVMKIAIENLDRTKSGAVPGLPAGDFVRIAVTDSGSGMTPEVLEQALQPFFTTKAKGSGTGLGLSMVYRFVKQTGGHIELKSQVGRGTTVSIYLPQAASLSIRPGEGSIDVASFDVGGRAILVTEDDDAVRRATVGLLRDLGFEVFAAADADQAMALLASTPHIDLLFSDVYLKGSINGYELATKAAELRPDLKIAFCSGNAARPEGHPGLASAPLLRKPYSPDDLRRTLSIMLAGDRKTPEVRH